MAVWEVVSRAFVFLQWKDQYILILMEERDQREEQYMNEYKWELNRERICRLKDYVVYLLINAGNWYGGYYFSTSFFPNNHTETF